MNGPAPAWIIAAVSLLLIPIVLLLDAGAGSYASGFDENAPGITAALASAVVGALLATRRPRNPIGWILLGNALVLVLSGLAPSYAGYALAHNDSLPGVRFAAVFDTHDWPLLFAGLTAIAYVFPDGLLPSRRWRPVAIVAAVSFILTFVTGMLGDEPLDSPFRAVEPYGVSSPPLSFLHGIGLLAMTVTVVLAFVALGSRFRGASGVLRAQLKWITYAGGLIPLAIVVGMVEAFVFGGSGAVSGIALMIPLIAVPAAIAVAVLRYRLYEIDRLINVTLVYATLSAVLGAGFAAIAVLGGLALGGGSAAPTAAATLAVAIAFRPVRDRVQALVDRRLNPEAYEGLRRVDRFLADLREGRAAPEQIGAVLAAAVSDPSLRLFFWLPRDGTHADADGRVLRELPSIPSGQTPVRRAELQLGIVVHDPKLAEKPRLLEAAINRAGLAIEIARLRVEVRHQLAEVEQSRARIVAAGDEERRRLERDLHDGAQQRLISIGLQLRHLQRGLGPNESEAKDGLDSAVAALGDAVEELRELARGVRPASLDGGLAPALRELAARAPISTEVQATEERCDREVETAAYFVASEALTNAVKHAGGSRVVLRAGRENGRLTLSVADDGGGGATPDREGGLTGLADRVEALGGRLTIISEPGRGTSLVAELPCES
jgi:signal transduction histidine kinase